MTPQEIDEQLMTEGVKLEKPEIPTDAHSVFRFEIKENVPDLIRSMKKVKNRPQKRMIDENGNVSFSEATSLNPWEVVYPEKGNKTHYLLSDPNVNSDADVTEKKDGSLEIITAWGGYQYIIQPNEKGGSSVEFHGPLNGLLRQNLLPDMTYVPHTLEAKFVSSDDKHDLTEFMSIEYYCALREAKNNGKQNEQDTMGYHVNRAFNNEIPALPYHEDAQTYKNKRALQEHERTLANKGLTEFGKMLINRRKEEVRKKIAKLKEEKPKIRNGIRASTPVKTPNRER